MEERKGTPHISWEVQICVGQWQWRRELVLLECRRCRGVHRGCNPGISLLGQSPWVAPCVVPSVSQSS